MTGAPWLVVRARKHHGLGNRVRVLMGGRALARQEGRRLLSVWPVNRWFGAKLSDLWDVPDRPLPAAVSMVLSARYPYRDHEVTGWLDDHARRAWVWQIRTPHALRMPASVPPWTDELRALHPAQSVREEVTAFHREAFAGAPYLGVMLRTHPHSHPETRVASPLAWYIDRLQAVAARTPEVRFFVSADTDEGLRTLQRTVPGCVGLSDKGAYNSRRALQASLADLYLLAGSAHIFGPHYSSFPELAIHLAGPPVRLETSRTSPEDAWEAVAAQSRTVAKDPLKPWERRPWM